MSTSASTELREQKAQYVNVDPRPLEDGDFAVVALESLAGVEGEPVKQDEMVLEIGGADTLPGLHREPARPVARRRKGIRRHLSGGLRLRAPGRQDGALPRHGEGRPPEGIAGAERRVRAGPGRLPQRGRIARGAPQVHLRASASTRRSRRPRTRSSTSWWTRTISRCPKSSSSGRSGIAWSRACAPWRREGVDPRSIKLDWEKVKETQREKALREVKASLLLSPDRGAGSHRRHARRSGSGGGAAGPAAAGAGRGRADAV